eukprot:scaffold2949_cov138-Skeletonema_menzelii.AAC.1
MSLEGLNIDDHNIPLTIGIGTVVSEVQKTRQSCDYLLLLAAHNITHVLEDRPSMFVPESGISRWSAALPAVPEGGGGTKMMMVDEERMIGEIQHNMSDGTNYREAGNRNKSRKRSRKRFRESVALSHNSTSTDEHDVSTKQLDKIEKLVAADIAICISNQSKTVALLQHCYRRGQSRYMAEKDQLVYASVNQ